MKSLSRRSEELFRDEIESRRELYADDVRRWRQRLNGSTAKYLGNVVDSYFQPMFFDSNDTERFTVWSDILNGIFLKIVAEYLESDEIRRLFDFSPEVDDLIRVDPGYGHPAPMIRADLFYSRSEESKFCEFNTDGTSGMNETNELDRIFLDSAMAAALQSSFDLSYFELIDSWTACLLHIYREFCGRTDPSAAIVDWDGTGVREEFKAVQRSLRKRDLPCAICDPRELTYTGKRLELRGSPVDLVYRRAVNFECFDRADEIGPLIQAYRDGKVCMVGPFRSQIIHNKKIFRILGEPEIQGMLSGDELKFVHDLIPETRRLTGNGSLLECALYNREQLLIKPEDRYAAKEVYAGKDMTTEEWKRVLREKSSQPGYLLQDFVRSELRDFHTFEDGDFHTISCGNVLGMFMYAGKFQGLYPRVSPVSIIASRYNCRIQSAIMTKDPYGR